MSSYIVAPSDASEASSPEQKAVLDALRPRKIDLADRVLIVDRGPQENARWAAEAAEALELAPGTGPWTVHLAPRVERLTLVAAADAAGIDLQVRTTGRYFQYGVGARRS